VVVENVSGDAENSVRINGSPASRIDHVLLKNISVSLGRWTKYAGGVYDNRPTKVVTPVEAHDTDGFNLRFADQVSLENCSVNWLENCPASFRNSLAAEDVTALQVWGFKGDSAAHPISWK
jgi:hypothetical protein